MSIESFRQHNLKYLQALKEDYENQPEGIREVVNDFGKGLINSWEAMRNIGREIERGV